MIISIALQALMADRKLLREFGFAISDDKIHLNSLGGKSLEDLIKEEFRSIYGNRIVFEDGNVVFDFDNACPFVLMALANTINISNKNMKEVEVFAIDYMTKRRREEREEQEDV